VFTQDVLPSFEVTAKRAAAPAAVQGFAAVAEAPAAEAPAADETPAVEADDWAGSAKATADGEAPTGFDIKGNKDSMLYHTPGSRFYKQTVAEVWFDSEESAEAAGFSKPPSQQAAEDAADEAADAADSEESE